MKTYLLHHQGGAHAGGQANDIKSKTCPRDCTFMANSWVIHDNLC